jgi:hypothetical protein
MKQVMLVSFGESLAAAIALHIAHNRAHHGKTWVVPINYYDLATGDLVGRKIIEEAARIGIDHAIVLLASPHANDVRRIHALHDGSPLASLMTEAVAAQTQGITHRTTHRFVKPGFTIAYLEVPTAAEHLPGAVEAVESILGTIIEAPQPPVEAIAAH